MKNKILKTMKKNYMYGVAIILIIAIIVMEAMMATLDKAHILDVLLLLKWKTLCLEMKIK